MPTNSPVTVAAVQAAPVFFDIDACLDKAAELIADASARGCDLIAFGEAWFPGYPFQIWLGSPAWAAQFTLPFHQNALVPGSDKMDRLCSLARDAAIMVSAGIAERKGGTLYLSQVLIGPCGDILSLRRKLKPTHVERSIFGEGYGEDLAVTGTELGKVGQLCCWEHLQPLSKYAMYAQSEQIHVAAWPAFVFDTQKAHALGAVVNMAASRLYAVEGQCFVVASTSIVNQQALDYFKIGSEADPLICLGGGSAMIFAPDGRELGDYLHPEKEGLVIAQLNLEEITMAKAFADPGGHYSKPESTRLIVNRRPFNSTTFIDEAERALPAEGEFPACVAEA